MALLDGKYEITGQQAVQGMQTLIEATAPDGTPVRIVWYELSPQHERRFEHYRRTLKKLKRSGHAALHDVVSRPGAHYVAWERPSDVPAPPDEALVEALNAAGYPPETADVRGDGGRVRIYGLAFGGEPAPTGSDPTGAETEPTARRAPPWLLSWALTAGLTVTAALLLLAGFNLRTNDRMVLVPDLLGQPLERALEALEERGLAPSATPVASSAPANTVLEVDPAAGSQLRPGRRVRLSYALPADRIAPTEVPQLLGLEFPQQVELRLREAGLVLGRVAHIPANTAAGIVIGQGLPAGMPLGREQAIDVLVSEGPKVEVTFLPDLTGLPLEDARFLARTAGLSPDRVLVDWIQGPQELAGQVLSQSLPPHLPVPVDDTTLRLVVAEATTPQQPEPGIPNLIGLSESEARAAAVGYQLTFEVRQIPTLPEGIVDQRPEPGSRSEDDLTLVVNIHPVEIPVPQILAQVLKPEPRELSYTFLIEPGIPVQMAEVVALSLEGVPTVVNRVQVQGGDLLTGSWQSPFPGPVTFRLLLNGAFYTEQRVNP